MQWSLARYGIRLALLTAALSGLVAAGTGCGASSDGCKALAKAVCDKQTSCSTFLAQFVAFNPQKCIDENTAGCMQNTSSAEGAYTDSSAAACAAAQANLSCDEFLIGPKPTACLPPGKRPLAASCGSDFQCQSLFCARTQAGQCGVCTAVPMMGEPCVGICGGGLQCSCAAGQTTCAQGTCQPYRKAGEMCDTNFFCLPSLTCTSGTCSAPKLGAVCSDQTQCSRVQSQYCNTTAMSCAELPFMVNNAGETCGAGQTMVYFCGADLYCKTPANENFGVCTPQPGEKQPCDDNSGCAGLLECVNGTCTKFDPSSCK